MTTTQLRVGSRYKSGVRRVIDLLMNERLEFSVFPDPAGDGWVVLGRVENLEERKKQELAQAILTAHLGIPKLE